MSTFRQTNDGDLTLEDGKLVLVEGAEESAIRLRNRQFSVRGEWFADASIGIPYLELIFVKNPDMGIVRNIYRQAVETIPGVAKLENLTLDLDKDSRNQVVNMEVRHEEGALITGGSGTPFIVEDI